MLVISDIEKVQGGQEPKSFVETCPDQVQRKSTIKSLIQLPPIYSGIATADLLQKRDADHICGALALNIHIAENELPAYVNLVTELYKEFGLNVKNFVGFPLKELEIAQTVFASYKVEFPNKLFRNTMTALLPQILEKGHDPALLEQAVKVTFDLFHQREPFIIDAQVKATEKYKSLLATARLSGDTDTLETNQTKRELEYFQWPNEDYDSLIETLSNAPTIEHYIEAVTTSVEINRLTKTCNTFFVDFYSRIFMFTPSITSFRAMNGLLKKSVLLHDDPSHIILRGGNIWSVAASGEVDAGVGGFVYNALTKEITPYGLHELLEQANQIPGSSLARYEQNRRDAYNLIAPFGNLRDFIHDQLPDIHGVLSAMLDYYETGQQSELQLYIDKYQASDRIAKYLGKLLLEKDRYTMRSNNGELILDVLKRIQQNTAPIQELPAQTGIIEIDQSMSELCVAKEHSGGIIDLDLLDKALSLVNSELSALQDHNQIGVVPNFIIALAWLEHQTAEAILQRVRGSQTNQQIAQIYQQHWFSESIKLFLHTHSNVPLAKEGIDSFVHSLQIAPTPEKANQIMIERVRQIIEDISKLYKTQNKDTEVLWTGNMVDAYLTLSDSYTPATNFKRAQILIHKTIQEEQEAAAFGHKLVSEFIHMPSPDTKMYYIQPGIDTDIDSFYDLYQSVVKQSLLELPTIQQQYKQSWEIAYILKALHINGEPIKYGTQITPLQHLDSIINGKQVTGILFDEAGLGLAVVSIDGEQIQDKNELISKLGLPAVYKSITREGD